MNTIHRLEDHMTDKRKAYEEKHNAELEEWFAQIDLLKARAGKAKAESKIT